MTIQSYDRPVTFEKSMPKPTFFNLPEEKRQRLIDVSLEEFASNDYESASISKIVSLTGIAKGSLYQYFEDKLDLYRYLLELAVKKKGEFMAAAKPPQDKDLPLFEFIRWMFHEMAHFQMAYPQLSRLGYRATYGNSPLPEDVMANSRLATQKYFKVQIEAAQQKGEIRQDADAEIAAYLITNALTELGSFLTSQAGVEKEKLADNGYFPVDNPSIQAAIDKLLNLLEFGLNSSKEQ